HSIPEQGFDLLPGPAWEFFQSGGCGRTGPVGSSEWFTGYDPGEIGECCAPAKMPLAKISSNRSCPGLAASFSLCLRRLFFTKSRYSTRSLGRFVCGFKSANRFPTRLAVLD